jgi:beta-N-acetylhexosaminidase
MGYHLDLAPVVDVFTNPANTVIGDRAFGTDAAVVARCATAFIRSMQGAGCAACAKHFPGHGDTTADSHKELPRVEHERARLEAVEWPPFRAAIDAGVAAVMTAHVLVPAIDPDYPATLSPRVLAILREQLTFNRVIISDDLGMGALARIPFEERVVGAVQAGCDLLLICSSPDDVDRAFTALVHAEEEGRISRERLTDSVRRLDALWCGFVKRLPTSAQLAAVLGEVRS